MAIDADFIAFRRTVQLPEGQGAPVPVLPARMVTRVSATGFIDITGDAEVFSFNNLSTSQTVYLRLNLDSDNTAAASGDNQSIRVEAGKSFDFGLPVETDATAYKLSVG